MKQFEPKKVICTQSSLTYKYECKNIHKNELGHSITNAYRFLKGVPYLIKNQEDYEEIIALNIFEDYVEPETIAKSVKSETTKERKLRKKAEAKRAKEIAEQKDDEVISDEADEEIIGTEEEVANGTATITEPSIPDLEEDEED